MNPILPGAPWLIAHKSMLGINLPYKVTLNGTDYVLWQNVEGKVFGLKNICPHMQAPLHKGWICQQRNTITCPFHALEFSPEGQLYREGKFSSTPISKKLEIICVGDYIWTYGGYKPKVPLPNLIERVSEGFEFVGIVTPGSCQGNFLNYILMNYDFNHLKGTHKDLFNLEKFEIYDYEEDGLNLKLKHKIIRGQESLEELRKNPVAIILPKTYVNNFEYSFPSLTSVLGNFPFGKALQINVFYPENEQNTQAFILVFAQGHSIIIKLLKNLLLKSVAKIFKQDIEIAKSLYSSHTPQVKLPSEEIIDYAKQLYYNWENNHN